MQRVHDTYPTTLMVAMQTNKHRSTTWALLLAISFVSGGTFLGIEVALQGTSPAWLAASRITIAAAVLGGFWCLKGRPPVANKATLGFLATLCLIAMTNTVAPFMLVSWAQQHVSSGFAGISMSSVALMVVPLAHFACPGERMYPWTAIGMAIGFIGVMSLFAAETSSGSDATWHFSARFACVAAAFCYATSSILVRRLGPVNPLSLAVALLTLGAIVAIPVAAIVDGVPEFKNVTAVSAIFALAVFPTALTGLMAIVVVQTAGASFMSLSNYLTPIWAVVFGIVILGESISTADLVSFALILFGVALTQIHNFAVLGAIFATLKTNVS